MAHIDTDHRVLESNRCLGRRAAAVALAVICAASICVSARAGSKTPVVASHASGVYVGNANLAGVVAFQQWAGEHVSYVVDFLDGATWQGIAAPWFIPGPWAPGKALTSNRTLVLSVPMIPRSGGTLQQGAAGDYNQYFHSLAIRLAQGQLGARTIIRLGWEFNSGWSPWSAASDPAAYAEYFRQVVTTMRAVLPNLRFDWCPSEGSAQFWGLPGGIGAAYPGDAYVDYIGMDAYDQAWGKYGAIISSPAARWAKIVGEQGGLEWQARFAAAHHKPMSFPEWGLTVRQDGHGGGDDVYYITHMYHWFETHPVAYQAYFEFDASDGAHVLSNGQFPKAAAAFRSLFGTAKQS